MTRFSAYKSPSLTRKKNPSKKKLLFKTSKKLYYADFALRKTVNTNKK